jgi:methionyl-tRNA formyltransferase
VYTKSRHISKIIEFLNSLNLKHEIFTKEDNVPDTPFDLGVSYCYPKKISNQLLNIPKMGFVNYHPGPLPKYKGPNEYEDAIKNKEIHWGVTVHYMTEKYDSGEIIKILKFNLHEPPKSIEELGAVSHYFLFNLFKGTISNINLNKLN